MIRYGVGKAAIGSSIPGWRLLLFVALRRRAPVSALLLAMGLTTAVALPFRLAPAPTFTVTVTVPAVDNDSPPIAAIQVFAGRCLLAEATPSPASGATLVLPSADYVVTARPDGAGLEAGWAMDTVPIHPDRDLDVAIGHEVVPGSDLASMLAAPTPSHCSPR
jgi:hypothetical protein